ncbi:alpha/beta fold hydrolase [Abyssisolibacter fermentans]|uniref:alpha/beta fold hydrolase n=1 Tax=Abyssisolibacter fermentans TaxID=1766203 RepID=UPI00082B08C9|nr:alpha/beta hydrolase [Abyssisolibacter fermentans]
MEFSEFKEKVRKKKYNVEFGIIESNLFADEDKKIDEFGIRNRGLKIFYLIRKGLDEESPYIIFFNGGPGIGFSEQFFEHDGFSDFLPNYNIIFMDQRGTGFSDKPSQNLNEYKYFTSKYICYDAEEIRKNLLCETSKWVVFGQSFGGHIVRKYLELYSESALLGISHGYGECSPLTMKINIEKVLFGQVKEYFEEYPEDKKVFIKIKENLFESDVIGNNERYLKGKDIMDVFSFYFGLYTYNKIHEIVKGFNEIDMKKQFLGEIRYLGNLILNSGVLNAVVAHIDLVDGLTDKELYKITEENLLQDGVNINDELFSTIRLSKNIVSKSKNFIELDNLFERKNFSTDPINLEILCNKLQENDVMLYVIGSRNDSLTPVKAIEEEKCLVESYNVDNYYKFIFSEGNHREWKENQKLLEGFIRQAKFR